jgi:glutathione S-transferase
MFQSFFGGGAMQLPILYSFRRCPYAMRARMTLLYAGIKYEHREILLREKPLSMLEVSPKGTVPVLIVPNETVLDESLDIMCWALKQNDPDAWFPEDQAERRLQLNLIEQNDTEFKWHLDRYKYEIKDDDGLRFLHREHARDFLALLEAKLTHACEIHSHEKKQPFLFGLQMFFADVATFPFVRQFASVEPDWFAGLPYHYLKQWVSHFLNLKLFEDTMEKYPIWKLPQD